MLNQAFEAFADLGDDEELGPADWRTVKRYIASLNNVDSQCVHPHAASESDNNLDLTNLKDIRERLLNGKCLYFSPSTYFFLHLCAMLTSNLRSFEEYTRTSLKCLKTLVSWKETP